MPTYAATLRTLMDASITPERALAITHGILEGLSFAHSKGVCHRDLKPQNILFESSDSYPVIADFGVARFLGDAPATLVKTRDGARLANFEYAAPEQRRAGAEVDFRADIYALGLMATELFTGEVPHGLDAKKVVATAPTFGFLDPIFEAMRKQDPAARTSTVGEVLEAIKSMMPHVIDASQSAFSAVLGERTRGVQSTTS